MDNRPIGFFDSGLGGLTVVKEFMKIMPNENMIYFGDTGRVPYGNRGEKTIIEYAKQDINFLRSFDIKAIVVACGTVSSVALPLIKDNYHIPVIGVVEPTAVAALKATGNKRIGIIGTKATVGSGIYQKLLSKDKDVKIISKSCPLFVPLVENDYLDSEATKIVAKDYLQPMIENDVDTIILGCTHYPLLKDIISDIMGSSVKLINSGIPTANCILDILKNQDGLASSNKPHYQFYVSDITDEFVDLGSRFLDCDLKNNIVGIDINKY